MNQGDIRYTHKLYSGKEVISLLKDKTIQLEIEYYRKEWNFKQKSLFIESVLLNLPIPPFYLDSSLQNKDTKSWDKWIIIDGYNRLKTLSDFCLQEAFALTNLEYLKGIEGKKFQDFSLYFKRLIQEYEFNFYILDPETPIFVRHDFFNRFQFNLKNFFGFNNQKKRNILNFGVPTMLIDKLVQTLNTEFSGYIRHKERFALKYVAFCITNDYNMPNESTYLNRGMNDIESISVEKQNSLVENFEKKIIKIKNYKSKAPLIDLEHKYQYITHISKNSNLLLKYFCADFKDAINNLDKLRLTKQDKNIYDKLYSTRQKF